MKGVISKNSTWKNSFYFKVLSELKLTTNLSKVQEKLNISKQQLNYYLRGLKKEGLVINKSRGLWEVAKSSKNSTKYGNFLPKDFIRGHACIINIKIPQEIKGWNRRIEILKKNNINYKLVGARLTTPRIKALGRKVWLCNNHLRIFDKKNQSYYGENAIESRKKAFWEIVKVILTVENKLGINLRPFDFDWRKEHYALIKNDLAIDQNQKGIIWRISDKEGEWLLVDDSLEEGGELENIGKKALQTNIPMQKWWNDHKKHKFEVTPTFVLNMMNGIQQNQQVFAQNMVSHVSSIKKLGKGVNKLTKVVGGVLEENRILKRKLKNQSSLGEWI